MESKVVYQSGMAFQAELNGHTFLIDGEAHVGGEDKGPRPKGLLLTALAGCTAMDVISILHKMRIEPTRFEVAADGTLADEHPKRFTEIVVRYLFEGADLPLDKLQKAVTLSEERYCGVSATLRPAVQMRHEIWINGKKAE